MIGRREQLIVVEVAGDVDSRAQRLPVAATGIARDEVKRFVGTGLLAERNEGERLRLTVRHGRPPIDDVGAQVSAGYGS